MSLSSWLKTVVRDTRALYRFSKVKIQFYNLRRRNETVGNVFDTLAKKNREKPCFYFNDQIWSYTKVEIESNRIGNYFSQQGFAKGEVVALFMTNRVEIVITWLGLSKIGVVPALVNANIASDLLKHSVSIVKPKAIICGKELSHVLEEAYKNEKCLPVYYTGEFGSKSVWKKPIDMDIGLTAITTNLPVPTARVNFTDDLFYIYTSGTTGLPKAAVVKHSRYFLAAFGKATMINVKSTDVAYTCFPLQHTTAGMIATGFALHAGVPLVIRSKFSASEFWKDCIKYNVTVAQYIGEACRYLLKQPVTPEETKHKVRMMTGNGLRPEIWAQFQERFKIPLICEFYGSTEGNCTMFNMFGHPGSFGFIPPKMKMIVPVTIIKLDDEDSPIRNAATGLVEESPPGEPGELVGKMVSGDPVREYQGYVGDAVNSEKKVLQNVLSKGDKFFRTGDICYRDEDGYFYFKDRIGDSFRFKGENVSATQVEGVINKLTHSHDVIVYGVQVPHVDGSVGMAAIADPSGTLDLDVLAEGIAKELPDYSRPRFLRIPEKIENTETHKLKKSDFKKDGINFQKIGKDKVYLFQKRKFVPLTVEMVKKINAGETAL